MSYVYILKLYVSVVLMSQTDKYSSCVTEPLQTQESFDLENVKIHVFLFEVQLRPKNLFAVHLFNTRGTILEVGGQSTKPDYRRRV